MKTNLFALTVVGLALLLAAAAVGGISNGGGSGIANTIGVAASLPASGTSLGDQYNSSDGPYKYIWNGSSWKIFVGSYAMDNPNTPAFGWGTTQGGATVSSTTGPVILTAPASASDALRVRDIAVPATPYSITIKFNVTADTNNFVSAGLSLRDSGSGKLTTLALQEVGKITRAQWTNQTTFSAQSAGAQPLPAGSPFLCFKVADDGTTNRTWYYSMDGGQTFQQYLQEARTTFITPTHVGFFVDSSNSKAAVITLLGWTQGVS